jgi:hypothetical protein
MQLLRHYREKKLFVSYVDKKEIEIRHELKKSLSVTCEWSVAFGYSGFLHRGSQLYLHITRYVLTEEGRTRFLLPKVKVEFRHLFSLQKWFSLCSSHKINANIVVFC